MPVTMLCPNLKCRAVLQVPDSKRGKKVRCGQCGTAFMVPHKHDQPSAPTPSKTTTAQPVGE